MSEPAKKRGLPMRVKMRHDTHFVEALNARHETPVGRMVPLAAIEPDQHQPRTSMGELAELAASIRDKGVLEPILVRPLPPAEHSPGGPAYRIISGERRYRAAQEAGLFEIPAIEMDVSEQEALEIALIENLQRKDLTPFEEAEGYRALAERHGYTHEEIGAAVGRSRSLVTESLSLLAMPPRVRDTVQGLGISSKSLLLEVLKGGDEPEMIRLLEEVAAYGLNRDDLRRRLRSDHPSRGSRRKPFTFKFRSPDKAYSLAVSFRQSEVERADLIRALEEVLSDLRKAAE
ncbi:MAG TPA: ParB/RepB/Spo0J family partition protein [Thermoanaerobaculia bacterium]|nr:ParB/RepB/Spo0J family partition protein [Thermoanaerobaculia bacterium]